eukprot:1398212-Pyramimonas_sp.AAC.1
MLPAGDLAILADPLRNFPLACGFLVLPEAVAPPPPGSGTNPCEYWCRDPLLPVERAFEGDVFTD